MLLTPDVDEPLAVFDGLLDVLEGSGNVLALGPAADRVRAADVDALAARGVAVALATSGSGGAPKTVLLSRTAVVTAARLCEDVHGGGLRWHLALPAGHVAGLMVLARAAVAGLDPWAVDTGLTHLEPDPDARNAVSLVPTQLHRALADDEIRRQLTRFDLVLLGGQAAGPELERARAAGVRVVTTYGMTETCGGVVHDGVPLPGVRLEFGRDQRLTIVTPTAFSGYLDEAAASQVALVAPDTVRTADRGRLVHGRLRLLGRTDDVVVSGGHNVDLAEVERAAREVLDADTVAVARPDAEWGVVVAVATEADVTLADLQERLRERLTAPSLPRALSAGRRLPRTASGKVDRPLLVREEETRWRR